MSKFAILGSRGYPSYYGGFETLVRHLAPYLLNEGHDVVVYARGSGLRRVTRVVDGVEVRLTPGVDRKSTSTLTYGLSASVDLARNGCDAALVLNVANAFWLRRLVSAGIPTCVNVDGLEWLRGKWGPVARKTFLVSATVAAREADALVFDSKELAKFWQRRFGRSGHFIPYGAPVLGNRAQGRLQEAGLPLEGYVLAVARIVPENNVDLLLDCVSRLDVSTPVIIVGDANYHHETVNRLRSLASTGRITWLGHVDDQALLNELWMNAGVYWHGHSVGGTNPALLQALGAGAPTLALDTPFNREVIGHESQLVPLDAGTLAARVAEVLSSPALADGFRRRGQAIVAERYAWPDVCADYEQLLSDLAFSRKANLARRRPQRGRIVAVVGPDGAGKSTLTSQLRDAVAARPGADAATVNFRSRHLDALLGRANGGPSNASAAPHSTPARSFPMATLKALAIWADLVLSAVAWRRSRKTVTFVERYAYDLLVDPARLGIVRAPRRLRESAVRLTPAPDAIIMCSAPASVLHSRKPELPESEATRQYSIWATLRPRLGVPCIDIDTTQPVDPEQLAERLLAALEQ